MLKAHGTESMVQKMWSNFPIYEIRQFLYKVIIHLANTS